MKRSVFFLFISAITFTSVAQTMIDSIFYNSLILRLSENYRYFHIPKEELVCDLKYAKYSVRDLTSRGFSSSQLDKWNPYNCNFLQIFVELSVPLTCFNPERVIDKDLMLFKDQYMRLIIAVFKNRIYRISGFHHCDIFELIVDRLYMEYALKCKKKDFLQSFWIENINMELFYKELKKRKINTVYTYEFYDPPNKQGTTPKSNDSTKMK